MSTEPVLVWNKEVKNTELEKFKKVIEAKYSVKLDSYWELHRWTLENLEDFFGELWSYFQVIASKPYEKVYLKTGDGFLDNEWFSGALFNFAENQLRIRDDIIALIYINEEGSYETVTFAEMYEQVRLYAAAFRKHGLQKGDIVAGYMSNRNEAVFAMLATSSIGAIWGGPEPFSSAQVASNILNKMEAKFLITEDGFLYYTEINLLPNITTISENVSSLKKIIIVATKEASLAKDISNIKNSCFLTEFLESGKLPGGGIPELIFEQLPANHPVFITHTSGSTGPPKGVVHSGQVLIPLLIDAAFYFNVNKGDTLLNPSQMSESDWIFFLSSLALGVTIVNYAADYCYIDKDGRNFWDVVAQHNVKFAYVVVSYIDKMEKEGFIPSQNSNLENLKIVALGGSPLKVHNYTYITTKIKKDVFIANCYGISESFGLFGAFDLNLPLYAGECQVPALGKSVQCYDCEGKSLIGENGELVLTNPSPSFPLYILKDDSNKIMNTTYLDRYPGAWWVHDEARINPLTKGIVVIGRSDEVIHQDGEVYGPDEIYSAIHDIDVIKDYICVRQHKSSGEGRGVLFVQLKEGNSFTPAVKRHITEKIATHFKPTCIPEVILETKEVPYSLYGKRMENLVRKILSSNQIPKVNNLQNPDSLLNFINIPEIVSYITLQAKNVY